VSSEPGWRNNWSGEGYIPDYSGIKDRLEALLAKGHADDVVSLGKDLLEAGKRQVEMSHDEGETAREVSSCLEVVFRALPCLLSLPSKRCSGRWMPTWKMTMIFATGRNLSGRKSIKFGLECPCGETSGSPEFSSIKEREDDFSWKFRRDKLSNWVILALENAGQKEEILSLCRKEAEITGNYPRLVEWLREFKKYQERKNG